MAIISTYPVDNNPQNGDYLIGTKVTTGGTQINPTKNFTIESVADFIAGNYAAQRIISKYQWLDVAPETYFNIPNATDTNIPFNTTKDIVSQKNPSVFPTRNTAGVSPAAETTFSFPAELYGTWKMTLKIHLFDQFNDVKITAGVRNRTGGVTTYLQQLIDDGASYALSTDKAYEGIGLIDITAATSEIDFVVNCSTNTPFPSANGNNPCELILEYIA